MSIDSAVYGPAFGVPGSGGDEGGGGGGSGLLEYDVLFSSFETAITTSNSSYSTKGCTLDITTDIKLRHVMTRVAADEYPIMFTLARVNNSTGLIEEILYASDPINGARIDAEWELSYPLPSEATLLAGNTYAFLFTYVGGTATEQMRLNVTTADNYGNDDIAAVTGRYTLLASTSPSIGDPTFNANGASAILLYYAY